MTPGMNRSLLLMSVAVCVIVGCLQMGACGPVPKVNEQQQHQQQQQSEVILPKIPQWHCLRYFKHDLLMMRRCRHVFVPTAPRSDATKLQLQINDWRQYQRT